MNKNEFIENEAMNFKNQMDTECEEQKVIKGTDEIPQKWEDTEDRKTITEWCIKSKINLLDPSYFNDEKQYTLEEFEEIVPKDIQIPLVSDLETGTALDDFARGIIPEQFAKDYKKMKKLQAELEKTEKQIKSKLLEMFESISGLEQKYVSMDGLRFTYVGPTKRKSVDSKKLQEEWPEIYKKCLKESNVKSQIRTSIEW